MLQAVRFSAILSVINESFSAFFSSPLGQLTATIAALICFFSVIGLMSKAKGRFTARVLTFTAVNLALAVILSMLELFKLPYGGSVTPMSMFFVTNVGYCLGPMPGLLAGITYSFLQLAIKPEVITPVQASLDYLFGFGLLGLSGLFYKHKHGLVVGYSVGVAGRFIASFISGMLFYGQYGAEYGLAPWSYSLAYNASYILPEFALTLIIINLPPVRKAIVSVKASFY